MTKTIILVTVTSLAVILFSYCKASKKGQDNVAKTCTPVLLDKNLYSKAVKRPQDLITVKSASIADDCLTLEVNTICCRNELSTFQLAWNEVMMKSMPPQINLCLFFDNTEKCDEAKDYTLKFDLKPVQSANPRGTVVLRVQGWEDRLTYEFGKTE